MADNTLDTGAISVNQAVDSLLANPPEMDTESEGRLGQEEMNAQPMEAEAEIIGEDTLEEEPSEDDFDDEADEVEELDGEYDAEEFEEEPVYTVAVDGEEHQVTLEELQRGYSRQQVYTKRSMELSEQRKAFEAEAQEVAKMRESYAQQLEQLSEQLEQTIPDEEPDWAELKKQGYSAEDLFLAKADYDKRRESLRSVEAKRKELAQEQMHEQQKQLQEYLAQQREEMLQRIPQWKDDDTQSKEKLEVVKYAQSVGFTEQQIDSAYDAKIVEILYKAMQWDNLQKKTPTAKRKARKAPKMAKAGQPKTKKQVASRQRQTAMNRLNKERSVDAAVDLLMGR